MSKLANLIKLKHELTNLVETIDITKTINLHLNYVTEIEKRYLDIDQTVHFVVDKLTEVSKILENENCKIIDNLISAIDLIDLQILNICNDLIYQQKFIDQSVTSAFIPKRSKIPNSIKKNLVASLQQCATWKYPTLIVNPIDKGLIDCAVASDPLYITYDPLYDFNHSILNRLILKFPQIYQNRLRIYELENYNFSALPKEQFSAIVNWNILNQFDLFKLQEYLSNICNLLRPGGVVLTNLYLTTAGDNDDWEFFDQIAINTLISICKKIGFNLNASDIIVTAINSSMHIPFNYACWITMRKPGTLSTVKAHQAMAKIIEK
jgi:hypothetical protein